VLGRRPRSDEFFGLDWPQLLALTTGSTNLVEEHPMHYEGELTDGPFYADFCQPAPVHCAEAAGLKNEPPFDLIAQKFSGRPVTLDWKHFATVQSETHENV
jgi:hypothetical protein